MNGAPSAQPIGRKLARSIRRHVKSWTRPLFKKPLDISKAQWWWLLVTLGLEVLAALALTGGQLYFAGTQIFSTLGAAILFAIAVANFWAFNSTRKAASSWARDAVIAEGLMLLLALYIIVKDVFKSAGRWSPSRSALSNWLVYATVVAVGVVALLWILLLAGRAEKVQLTKTAAIITALFPLAGLLQSWLVNYYLPGTSAPQIDISAELTPQTTTKPIIHLSAKITIHNRGTTRVDIPAALMRVTAYPKTTQQPEPSYMCERDSGDQKWCQIAGGVDISGANSGADFRREATPATNAQLLYAGLLATGGAFMTPGETDTVQREIDLDSSKFRLARLSISAVFLPSRRIEDLKSCGYYSKASAYTDPRDFSLEVGSALPFPVQEYVPAIDKRALGRYLCMNYKIALNDIIGWLTGDRSVVQVQMILSDPQDPFNEYPDIFVIYAPADRKGNPTQPDLHTSTMIREGTPMSNQFVVAEYAPGDPIPPKDKN